MNEPRNDPLKDEVRSTLRELHAPHPAPGFDATWAAAEQRLDHERRIAPRRRVDLPRWRYAPVWSAAAAAVALALTVALWLRPTADVHPILAGEPAAGTDEPLRGGPAARTDDRAGFAAVPARNDQRPDPAANVRSRSMIPRAQPVMWYAPSDRLLQVTSLSYTARPAVQTVYDPIHLEIRP